MESKNNPPSFSKAKNVLRVAQVVCTFPPYRGGMGNSAYHFSRLTAAAGIDTTVFTPAYRRSEGERRKFADGDSFKVVRLKPALQYGNAAFIPQLLWRLKGFDLIHLHYPFYGAMLPIVLRKLFLDRKTRLVLHYHMDSIGSGLKGLIFKLNRILVLPLLLRLSDFITCASLDYAKNSALTGYFERYQDKFITMPFGVDPDIFKAVEKRPSPEFEKNILFVATLDKAHDFKGLGVLLLALKSLLSDPNCLKQGLKISLTVVGSGEMQEHYQTVSRELGVADSVRFVGGLPPAELAGAYGRAAVFVLPSINQGEAFGLVLLESMACGTPVVASNLPGVRNVFHNGREGLSVIPGDAKDLAAKIKQILLDERSARRMSQAGIELVRKKYDWNIIGAELTRLYYRAVYTPKKSA